MCLALLTGSLTIRAFHDQVLKDGAMPLAIFEAKLDSWIKSQQAIAGKN